MILETRFRDVPWEELKCLQHLHHPRSVAKWNEMRGKPLFVETPPANEDIRSECKPNYRQVNNDGTAFFDNSNKLENFLCSHLIEVGD